MSNLPSVPSLKDIKQPGFWQRAGGPWAMVIAGVGALGIGWVALPILATMFTTMATLLGAAQSIGVSCAILFALWMVFTNERIGTLTKYTFQGVLRWMTGRIIELDPVNIMLSYVDDLTKKQDVIDGSITELSKQSSKLQGTIDENAKKVENELRTAKAAKELGDTTQFNIAIRQAERLANQNREQLIPLWTQMQAHGALLRKYSDATAVIRTDLKNEVDVRITKREIIHSSWGAMKVAGEILRGGTDERAVFDQAVKYVADDYLSKMGEIDNFIENSRSMMSRIDLNNAVAEGRANEMFEEWDKKADAFLSSTMTPSLSAPDVPAMTLDFSRISEGVKLPVHRN